MEPDIIDFKTQHIKVLINDASATSKPHKNFMRTHIHHRDDVALSRKKKERKKISRCLFFGKCMCAIPGGPGSITYRAIPAKLLPALIIHRRLFTAVLHVFLRFVNNLKDRIWRDLMGDIRYYFMHISTIHPEVRGRMRR